MAQNSPKSLKPCSPSTESKTLSINSKNTKITGIQASSKSPTSNSRKISSFFRKASADLNLFLLRIKSLGDEVFHENQVINELFDDSDTESILDKLERRSKGYNINEERFLLRYKKYKNLDKMHQEFQQTEDIRSSSTVYSDSNRYSVKDVIQESRSEEVEVDTDDETLDETCDKMAYVDLDMVKMRQQLEADPDLNNDTNVGDILWEYRRSRWTCGKKSKQATVNRLLFDQIPKESYVKVYNALVDKGRPLKNDRRINLYDLMKVVNSGWAAEEKWERAAKGQA